MSLITKKHTWSYSENSQISGFSASITYSHKVVFITISINNFLTVQKRATKLVLQSKRRRMFKNTEIPKILKNIPLSKGSSVHADVYFLRARAAPGFWK
jgi:hypothetical protein